MTAVAVGADVARRSPRDASAPDTPRRDRNVSDAVDTRAHARVVVTPSRRRTGAAGRRRGAADDTRGRYIRAAVKRTGGGLAADATLRATVLRPHVAVRGDLPGVALTADDLRWKVRTGRRGVVVLFVVDASWSMAVGQRMRAVKATVQALLTDAYLRRDRVGLIVFQGREARLLLEPTGSVARARRRLLDVPTGGRTPLAAALRLARLTFRRLRMRDVRRRRLMVVVTDADANVSSGAGDPRADALAAADALRRDGIQSLVVDAGVDRARTAVRDLAAHLSASTVVLEHFGGDTLHQVVKVALTARLS